MKIRFFILPLLALLLQSCAGLMDPELKELKVSSKWLNPSPHLRPVSGRDKLVYCSVRNTSGADIELRGEVRRQLQDIGYTITDDLDKAKFVLLADLRYFGQKSKKGYANTVGGAVIGGVTGGVIGNTVSRKNRGRNTAIGAAAGAVVGGVIGNVVDNSEKVRIYDLVVDIRLGEKVEGGLETRTSRNASRNLNSSVRGGTEAGRASSSSKESTSFTRREDFFYHEARLVCTAQKIGLTETEAQAPLTRRLSRQIGQLLP